MKTLLVGLAIVGMLASPTGAWAGGRGHHGHHHSHTAEYVALGILGGVLGGIVLGHALSEHPHYTPPARRVYVPEPVYHGPAYRYGPICAPHRRCYR
jgi:hypothetical protein